MAIPATADIWAQQALQWSRVGPPLRPSGEDLDFVDRASKELHGAAAPRVLLLGVTPELHALGWPPGTDFLAVDRNEGMIESVWPGPRSAVRHGEWLALDLPPSSRDIALCDGGLHLLRHRDEQERLAAILGDVLRPGGLFIVRLFVPPAIRESPAAVLGDLAAGRVPSLNILKLRLAMAMMASAEEGVELGRVWDAVDAVAPDRGRLAERIGWDREHLAAIDSYRGASARYHFVTIPQTVEMFEAYGFRMAKSMTPAYELGERCPTIVFERL